MFKFEMQSTCNAPEYMEGKYEMTIKDRRMTLKKIEDGKTNVKVRGTCHKDDQFDLNTGVNNVLNKMNEKLKSTNIKVGDRVRVVDNGKCYTTYSDWVLKNAPSTDYVLHYVFGETPKNDDAIFTVVAVAPHNKMDDTLYMISDRKGNVGDLYRVFVIGNGGIEKVNDNGLRHPY